MASAIQNTIAHLRLCQLARSKGYPVSFTTDPAWLVNQAINRRAGWLDDPGHTRGSCRPIKRNRNKATHWTIKNPCYLRRDGLKWSPFAQWQEREYPRKAQGEVFNNLRQLARRINTPRLIVRVSELGEWRELLITRMPERFTSELD